MLRRRQLQQKLEGGGLPSIKQLVRGAVKVARIVTSIPRRIALTLTGAREGATKRFQDYLATDGNRPITRLLLCRTPVLAGIQKALNLLSFGSLNRVGEALGYDDLYHNYFIVECVGTTPRRIEKNHVVEEFGSKRSDYQGQTVEIKLPHSNVTMRELIDRASHGLGRRFWEYNPGEENCQMFTTRVLTANGLTAPPEFIEPQDAKTLIASLGYFSSLPKGITDLASRLDRGVHGDGVVVQQGTPQEFSLGISLLPGVADRLRDQAQQAVRPAGVQFSQFPF